MEKLRNINIAAVMTIMTAASVFNSCIYESPWGDEFYRTLWKADEAPLGAFEASALTLEFLCNGQVLIRTVPAEDDSAISSSHGKYSFDGNVATFSGLSLTYDADQVPDVHYQDGNSNGTVSLIFTEAHRDGDSMFLIWGVNGMEQSFSTYMRRLSAYE